MLHYKIRLLNDDSIRWLHEQRIQQKILEIPENINIVWELSNITIILTQAADEILGKYKVFKHTKKLKM
jgi:hypothetical protein